MKKILIIDDEKEIRDLIAKKLAQYEYTTLTAGNGKEALSICKANPPDLILLDIAMPEMDGYEICAKLKKDPATQDIPVLLLTAKDLDPKGIIERYKNTGACGYISKPATFEELLTKIKEVIG
jgi:CheY-like chemotaxis protein